MAISEVLGEQKELALSAGTIRYRDRGSGPTQVFVHGAVVNGDKWRKVVPPLAEHYRCITPDWPLGSHQLPMRPDADLSPPGVAQIIIDFIDALGDEVTLISNDTGTALAQLVLARSPRRISARREALDQSIAAARLEHSIENRTVGCCIQTSMVKRASSRTLTRTACRGDDSGTVSPQLRLEALYSGGGDIRG